MPRRRAARRRSSSRRKSESGPIVGSRSPGTAAGERKWLVWTSRPLSSGSTYSGAAPGRSSAVSAVSSPPSAAIRVTALDAATGGRGEDPHRVEDRLRLGQEPAQQHVDRHPERHRGVVVVVEHVQQHRDAGRVDPDLGQHPGLGQRLHPHPGRGLEAPDQPGRRQLLVPVPGLGAERPALGLQRDQHRALAPRHSQPGHGSRRAATPRASSSVRALRAPTASGASPAPAAMPSISSPSVGRPGGARGQRLVAPAFDLLAAEEPAGLEEAQVAAPARPHLLGAGAPELAAAIAGGGRGGDEEARAHRAGAPEPSSGATWSATSPSRANQTSPAATISSTSCSSAAKR